MARGTPSPVTAELPRGRVDNIVEDRASIGAVASAASIGLTNPRWLVAFTHPKWRTMSDGLLSGSSAPANEIDPSVSVPVLSVQSTSIASMSSIASSRFTMTCCRAI